MPSIDVIPNRIGATMTQISFRCTSCNALLNGRAAHIGQQIRCPRCQTPLIVPQPEREVEAHSATEPPPTAAAREEFPAREGFTNFLDDSPQRPSVERPSLQVSVILHARKRRRDKVLWAVEILTTAIRLLTILGTLGLTLYLVVMIYLSTRSDDPPLLILLTVASTALGAVLLFVSWAASYLLVGAVALLADIHEVQTSGAR